MVRFRILIMLTLAIAACLILCTDSDNDTSLNPPKVLFSVTVHDSLGNPVPGLRVGSINHPRRGKAPSRPCPET